MQRKADEDSEKKNIPANRSCGNVTISVDVDNFIFMTKVLNKVYFGLVPKSPETIDLTHIKNCGGRIPIIGYKRSEYSDNEKPENIF